MHVANWRALPIIAVLGVAVLLFWGLVMVFGSESDAPTSLPNIATQDDLVRIPLAFPEVATPLMEALPSPTPEPSPEVVAGSGSQPRRRSTTTTTRPRIPTSGVPGEAVTGESGDPEIGPDASSGPADDDDDLVDIDDDVFDDDDVGSDEGDDEQPEEPEEPAPDEDENNNGSGSEQPGNDGSDGSNNAATDNGEND